MNPLYFYFHGANALELTGENSLIIKGCKYNPGSGKISMSEWGEVITETLEFQMEAVPEGILAAIMGLEKYVELAGAEPIEKDYVYLRFYSAYPVLVDWRSRVIGGSVALGGNGVIDREYGSQVVIVTITRLNYWFAPKVQTTGYTSYLVAMNGNDYENLQSHEDVNSGCTAYVDLDNMYGTLPSPAELKFETHNMDPFYQVTIAMRLLKDRALDVGYIEAEDLSASQSTKTDVDDAQCSGGHYSEFEWSEPGENLLARKTILAADLAYYRGMQHTAIMRLANHFDYTDLWMCAKILVTGTTAVLAESQWKLMTPGILYQELPPVAIPPDLAGYEAFGSVDYCIYAMQEAGGACQLDLDFLYLAPTQFMRKLIPLDPLDLPLSGSGKYLIDSGIEEKTYFLDNNQRYQTHYSEGAWLWLYPGYHAAIKIFMTGGGLDTFGLHNPYDLQVWYEPRVRML